MISSVALGALMGACAGLGALVLVSGVIATRRMSLTERVRRHSAMAAMSQPSGLTQSAVDVVSELCRPLVQAIPAWRGDQAALRLRLRRAGTDADVTRYRLSQAAWTAGGAAGGLVAGMLLAGSGGAATLLAIVGGLAGGLARDQALASAGKRRARRISGELPAIAELLAFAVSAGEPPLSALDRIARTCQGVIATEIRALVADVHGAMTLSSALREFAERCGTVATDRFVDGIVVAVERGTPIADVLRAQAADARAASGRDLMELAGRRDVLMMIPVVFLILPIVVVIALFPGIYGLNLASP